MLTTNANQIIDVKKDINDLARHNPNMMDVIKNNVSAGSSLYDIAVLYGVEFHDLHSWIHGDPDRKAIYTSSYNIGKDLIKTRLLDEVKNISFCDVSDVFDDDMALKPMSLWPKKALSAVKSIKSSIDGSKTVEFYDKLKAINMLGGEVGLFNDKLEVSGHVTLEQLVSKSMSDNKDEISIDRVEVVEEADVVDVGKANESGDENKE